MFPHCKEFLPLFFFLVVSAAAAAAAAGETRCIAKEREALLRFKQGITYDYYGCLSSWHDDNKECCEWDGVYCSDTTPSQVTYIDLYGCWLRGNISSDLLELHHLNYLDFSYNNFRGSIPDFLGSMTSLEDLRFMLNNFTGTIPHQLGNLTNLRVLTFNYNSLVHKIPKSFANLTNLQYFFVNLNQLGEPLVDFFGKISCKSLQHLDISYNQYTGPIPDLSACLEMESLKIQGNNLSGTIPTSLGKLPKLGDIDASFNSLQGTISESFFSESDNKLYFFVLAYNHITLDFSPDWIPPFQLETLALGGCKMSRPSFPQWLRTQTNISYVDISDAGISDQVPDWFWSFSLVVGHLNISYNQISGTIPSLSANFFSFVDVSSNNFSGPLPLLHPNITFAHFGQNSFTGTISSICHDPRHKLAFLDLSGNQFGGSLPKCWNNTSSLQVLNLNDNRFHGEIPRALGSLRSLETLHLRGNNLSGELPHTLSNCRNLTLIDVGANKLTGEISPWLASSFTNLSHLSFRQNGFQGRIPPEICRLSRIQMLDLSGNDISGEIPTCFDNFTALIEKGGDVTPPISFYLGSTRSYSSYVFVQWKGRDLEYGRALRFLKLIDLSSNRLTGRIPTTFSSLQGLISLNLSRNALSGRMDPNIGHMEKLETLDLSNNHLSGEIPIGLAQLHFLSVLDLSSNNLTGEIPLGTQLQGFNASAYSRNDGLCGPPLSLCRNTSVGSQGENMKKESDSFMNLQDFYIPLIFGAIVGFWGFVGSLVLKRSWRYAYFGFIEDFAYWFM